MMVVFYRGIVALWLDLRNRDEKWMERIGFDRARLASIVGEGIFLYQFLRTAARK